MAIVMVACLAFGGTYAYFTAQAKQASAGVTTGVIEIKLGTVQNFAFNDVKVVPGQDFMNDAKITVDGSTSTAPMYVFAIVSAKTSDGKVLYYATKDEPTTTAGSEDFEEVVAITKDATSAAWSEVEAGVYGGLYDTLNGNEDTATIVLDGSFAKGVEEHHKETAEGTITKANNVYTKATDGSYENIATIEGVTISIVVEFISVQAEGLEFADGADEASKLATAYAAAKAAYVA